MASANPASEVFFRSNLPSPGEYIHHTDDPISFRRHCELDKYVHKYAVGINLREPRIAARLLHYVLLDACESYPNHFAAPAEQKLRRLLQDSKRVVELLKTCRETGVYVSIRRLKIFLTPSHSWKVNTERTLIFHGPPIDLNEDDFWEDADSPWGLLDDDGEEYEFTDDLERMEVMRRIAYSA